MDLNQFLSIVQLRLELGHCLTSVALRREVAEWAFFKLEQAALIEEEHWEWIEALHESAWLLSK